MTRRSLVVCLAASSLLAGCALTGKNDPLRPRYYTPETMATRAPVLHAAASDLRLRLGRVVASSDLREEIPYRSSEHELGYYEDRRWTERPEVYLRRALARALFEQRGATRVVSGIAPTLEVELVAFEEVREPVHEARLEAIAILNDEQVERLQQTVTVHRPIADVPESRRADALVEALAEALEQAVAEISDRVLSQVAALEPKEAPAAIGASDPASVEAD